VQLKVSDIATLNGIRANRSFTYYNGGHSAGMVEPDTWLSSTYRTGGSLNFMGFSDPQLDAMIDKQRAIFDQAQRKAAVKEVVLYYIQHGPSIIAANSYTLDGVGSKVQAHLPENHINGYQYQRVWLDA
jgi:peptide/nickel transport system substrate-binding protein